jgi:lysylphosphatidylglycerol synthetase-like protein (DUF2156 family)
MLITTPLAAFGSNPLAIVAIILIVGALLLVDLLVFARGRQPGHKEAIIWSIGWLILGLLATIPIILLSSPADGVNYVTR